MAYFTRIEPDPSIARAYLALLDTIALYRRAGRTLEAQRTASILAKVEHDFEVQGRRNALKADAYIRDRLRQTQKRPDTPGPQHLSDKIVSRPLPTTAPAGAIGIGDLNALEQAINPRTGGVYWRAQEFGLPVAMRGAPAPGYFQPGMSAPSPGQFRVHPYFEQMPYVRGMPALVRTRPLKARHFLRDGARLAYEYHLRESRRITNAAVDKIRAI